MMRAEVSVEAERADVRNDAPTVGGRLRAVMLAAALATAGAIATSPAQAQSAGVPDPCDFATGGGFVITDTGQKANFGAHGGCKNGEFWGHVNYVDHATGYHVNSVEITAYLAPLGASSAVRDVCGIARTNRDDQAVWFRVRLIDNGEPGSQDQFGIKLARRTSAQGEMPATFENIYEVLPRALSTLKPGAGNVELHEPNASTVAVPVLLDEHEACGGLTFDRREEE
jgi:hypothetical protein